MTDELEERIKAWQDKGKKREEITYGMLNEGFQSIAGVPDEFESSEDPEVRERHWKKYQSEKNQSGNYLSGHQNCGWCSQCDPEYKD